MAMLYQHGRHCQIFILIGPCRLQKNLCIDFPRNILFSICKYCLFKCSYIRLYLYLVYDSYKLAPLFEYLGFLLPVFICTYKLYFVKSYLLFSLDMWCQPPGKVHKKSMLISFSEFDSFDRKTVRKNAHAFVGRQKILSTNSRSI